MTGPAPTYSIAWLGERGGVTRDGYAVSVFGPTSLSEVLVVVQPPGRRFPVVVEHATRELALAEAMVAIAEDRRRCAAAEAARR